MLRIGLTGGIGSGKTTVANLFARRGIPIIDADDIARSLVEPHQPAYGRIIKAFGDKILAPDGSINRSVLREVVFNNSKKRKRLEEILHPEVRKEIENMLANVNQNSPFCIIVVPLLIETRQKDLVDRILVVDTDEKIQIDRVQARNGLPRTEIKKIISAQVKREERLKHADDSITNNNDLSDLEKEVDRLYAFYLKLAARTQT